MMAARLTLPTKRSLPVREVLVAQRVELQSADRPVLRNHVAVPSRISPKRIQLLPFQRASCSARTVW